MRPQYLIAAAIMAWVAWSTYHTEQFMDVAWTGPRSYPYNQPKALEKAITSQQEILDNATTQLICMNVNLIRSLFNNNRNSLEFDGNGKEVPTVQADLDKLGSMLVDTIKVAVKQENIRFVSAHAVSNLWTKGVRQLTLDLHMANPSVPTYITQHPSIKIQCVVLYDNNGVYLKSIEC